MQKFCDLHTHSVFSDGTDTPFEIVKKAKDMGLSAVALTDHNTCKGLGELEQASKELSLEVVGGVEFSADYIDREVHIVALFIREENYALIEEFLSLLTKRKIESNIKLIEGLKSIGMDIDLETLVKNAPSGKINRANIASEMVKLGYVKSVKEAFDTVLSKTYGFYIEPKRPTAEETVKFIREIGAVPILAHPLLNFSNEELKTALKILKKAGLVAVETQYSTFSKEECEELSALAKEMGLLESGGSDYHGGNKPDIALGKGKGNLKIPYEFLEKIKNSLQVNNKTPSES